MAKKKGAPQPEEAPEPRRYEIELTRAAARGLASLPKADLRRVDAQIRALADNPRPPDTKKLQGGDDLYRIRSGDYRVVYGVDDDRRVVTITRIGHRRDVYRP
jgi:mRNA interferase RelE/StbE